MTRNHYTVVTDVNGIESSNSKVTRLDSVLTHVDGNTNSYSKVTKSAAVLTNASGIENSNSKVAQIMSLHMLMEIIIVMAK